MPDNIVKTTFLTVDETSAVIDKIIAAIDRTTEAVKSLEKHFTQIQSVSKATENAIKSVGTQTKLTGDQFTALGKFTNDQANRFEAAIKSGKSYTQAFAEATAKIIKNTAAVSDNNAKLIAWNASSVEAAQHEKASAAAANATTRAKLLEHDQTSKLIAAQKAEVAMLERIAKEKKAQVALGASMAADIDRRRKMTVLHSQALQENVRRNKSLNQTIKKQHGFFDHINEKIFRYRMMLISVMVAAYALQRALQAAWDFTYQGAQINEQMAAMDRLAAKYGTTSDAMIANLRRVSKETISNAQIVQSAGKAMVMGIAPDTLTTLMKVATAAARTMGKTANEMFADITLGTARMSKRVLDNVGMIVDWMAAYALQAAEIGKTVQALDEEDKMRARLNAIAEAGGKIVDTLNTKYMTQRERIDRLVAAWNNYWDTLKTGIADAIIPLEGIEKIIGRIAKTQKQLSQEKPWWQISDESWLAKFIPGLGKIRALQRDQLATDQRIKDSYNEQIGLQTKIREEMSKTQSVLNANQALLESVTETNKIEELKNRYDASVKAIEKQKKAIADLNDLVVEGEIKIASLGAKINTADKDRVASLEELKERQDKITKGYVVQRAEAIKALEIMTKNLPKIAKGITAEESKEQDKRLAGFTKLQERYVQASKKAQESITKITVDEYSARLMAIDRYLEAELIKTIALRDKELKSVKNGSEEAIQIKSKAAETIKKLQTAISDMTVAAQTEAAQKASKEQEKAWDDAGKAAIKRLREINKEAKNTANINKKFYSELRGLDRLSIEQKRLFAKQSVQFDLEALRLQKENYAQVVKDKELLDLWYNARKQEIEDQAVLQFGSSIERQKVLWEQGMQDMLQKAEDMVARLPINTAYLFADSFSNALASIGSGAQKAKDAFADMARSISRDIIQMTTRALIYQAIAKAAGFLGGGGGSISPGVIEPPMITPNVGFAAKGAVWPSFIPITANAGGGVYNRPTLGLIAETASSRPEIVTPEPLMRKVVREEIGRIGQGGGGEPVIIIQAMDAQSFQDFVRRNPQPILNVVSGNHRRGGELRNISRRFG